MRKLIYLTLILLILSLALTGESHAKKRNDHRLQLEDLRSLVYITEHLPEESNVIFEKGVKNEVPLCACACDDGSYICVSTECESHAKECDDHKN